MAESDIKIYQTEDGQTEINVRFENETVWLTQKQMAQLFDKDSDTIGLHLKNIYQSGELEEFATTEDSSVVQQEGKRQVQRKIKLFNLDAIISVGYRVNSKRGIQFRIWASRIIKEYLLNGFIIDNNRLIQQNSQLKKLQSSVKILGDSLNFKTLTNDESIGLLKIITRYGFYSSSRRQWLF